MILYIERGALAPPFLTKCLINIPPPGLSAFLASVIILTKKVPGFYCLAVETESGV